LFSEQFKFELYHRNLANSILEQLNEFQENQRVPLEPASPEKPAKFRRGSGPTKNIKDIIQNVAISQEEAKEKKEDKVQVTLTKRQSTFKIQAEKNKLLAAPERSNKIQRLSHNFKLMPQNSLENSRQDKHRHSSSINSGPSRG